MKRLSLCMGLTFFLLIGCQSFTRTKPVSEVLKRAQSFAPTDTHHFQQIEVSGTRFYVFTRKNPVLRDVNFVKSIQTYWPHIQGMFGIPVQEAAVIDLEGPFSGGPLAPFVLGIFSASHTDTEFQLIHQSATGWKPKSSTAEYISDHYGKFDHPAQSYVDDMIAHELGHLYFGFGLTKASEKDADWWFPVGLGLLYDRLAWSAVNNIPSPLFSSTSKQWKHFAKLPVDQRLINPDTTRDREYQLPRRQVYVHAKALAFLQAIRGQLIATTFDKYITELLVASTNKEIKYNDFLMMLLPEEKAIVNRIEQDFRIR